MYSWFLPVLGSSHRSIFVDEVVPSRSNIRLFACQQREAGRDENRCKAAARAWTSMMETGLCGKGIACAMAASVRSIRSVFAAICDHSRLFKYAIAALFFVFPLLGTPAAAQTTTISGTVYDPRTTGALPLSNVLVYVVPTGTVAPMLPSGAQCMTTSTPTPVVSFAYTDVKGTFTLGNVPINATYTLVIQAGKWRRQFSQGVTTTPITGLTLNMPADHTQGDIPFIAIATGQYDAMECVLRNGRCRFGVYRR